MEVALQGCVESKSGIYMDSGSFLFEISILVEAVLGLIAITIIGFGGDIERCFGILEKSDEIFYARQSLLLWAILVYNLSGFSADVALYCYKKIVTVQEMLTDVASDHPHA